jgi:hypothetical protein
MRGQYVFSIAAAVVMGFGVNALAEDRVDVREQLVTAVPEAIRLLEAKEYEEFLTSFGNEPGLLKETAENRGVTTNELAQGWGESDKPARLLQALRAIEGKTPKLDSDGRTATFAYDVKDDPQGKITFKKFGKYWYIRN